MLSILAAQLPTLAFPTKMFEGEQFTLAAVIFSLFGFAVLTVFAGFVALLRLGLRKSQNWRSIGLVVRIMGWAVPAVLTMSLWNGYVYPGRHPRPSFTTALIFWGVGTAVVSALSLLIHYLGRPNQGQAKQEQQGRSL